jgi:hypothetical protein
MAMGAKAKRPAVCAFTEVEPVKVPRPMAAAPEPKASTPRKLRREMALATTRSNSCSWGRRFRRSSISSKDRLQRDVFQGSLLWFWPGSLQGNGTFAGWRATTLVSGDKYQL